MMTDDEIQRISDELWAKVFHPEVVAGVKAAQNQLNDALLDAIDIPDPLCDVTGCGREAIVAAVCAHSGVVNGMLCADHGEAIANRKKRWRCRRCNHVGTTAQLVKWVPVFSGRSRA